MAGDIGSVAAGIQQGMGGLKDLVSAMGYFGAMMFGILAALKFKMHNENPERVPLSAAMTMMVLSAVLMTLPTLLSTADDVLGSPQAATRTAGTPAAAAAAADAAKALEAELAKQEARKQAADLATAAAMAKAAEISAASKTAPAESPSSLVSSPSAERAGKLASAQKQKAPKESSGNQSSIDFSTWMEVLAGLGLLGVGGWSMVIRSARRDRATRDARIELALAKSVEMGSKQGRASE